MSELKKFFTTEDEKLIETAIKAAELNTSGEVRVRIENSSNGDVVEAARKAFEKLGMRETELHNGVLFVLFVKDKKFVILGDDGINDKVPEGFWLNVNDVMLDEFVQGHFAKGLSEGIRMAGEKLAEFFPYQKDDVDELPNTISYAEEVDAGEEKICD